MPKFPNPVSELGLIPLGAKAVKAFLNRDETKNLMRLISVDIRQSYGLQEETAKKLIARYESVLRSQYKIGEDLARVLYDGDEAVRDRLQAQLTLLLSMFGSDGAEPEVLAERLVESMYAHAPEAMKSDRGAVIHMARRAEKQRRSETKQVIDRIDRLTPAGPHTDRESSRSVQSILRQHAVDVWSEDDTESTAPAGEHAGRKGRYAQLRKAHKPLVRSFSSWLQASSRKREDTGIRVFWLLGAPSEQRTDGMLACLDDAHARGREVADARSDLAALGAAVADCIRAGLRAPQPVIAVDLHASVPAKSWQRLADQIQLARGRRPRAGESHPVLLVAGTQKQAKAAVSALKTQIEMETVDGHGEKQGRGVGQTGPRLRTERVFNRGLPMTAKTLYGREPEEDRIKDAWSSGTTRIQSIVAFGGAGKSALANRWLYDMQKRGFMDAERVLAWSFYSQGTRDNLVSADEFVNEALKWLGHKRPVTLSAAARGHELASLIMERKFLLVLDGLEPLQYPTKEREVGGSLTDESMSTLLTELAENEWEGLCLITTRVAVKDLVPYETGSSSVVERIELDRLPPSAGAALLEALLGSVATAERLEAIAETVDCHALAVTLLGNYLRNVCAGNVEKVYDLEGLTVKAELGGHARRIMASYARFLRNRRRPAELALLRLMGLFDRPAPPTAMGALLGADQLASLTGKLDQVGSDLWNEAVEALRSMGLLEPPDAYAAGTLDAHPLVREHFRDELRCRRGRIWEQANATLCDYYGGSVEERPATIAGLQPLYSAVTHGCAAGLHQRVYDEILLPRVWHDRRTNYSTRQLGLTGADIVALSNYFDHHDWVDLASIRLTADAQTLIRTNAGVRLRQLGRLMNARECFGAVIESIDVDRSSGMQLEDASYAAAQSCELLVIAGKLRGQADDVDTALVAGERAVQYADKGEDTYFMMHARSSLAEVYFMLGDAMRAEALFSEAITIEHDRRPRPRPQFLYSQSLFRYGYHLIESCRAEEILTMEGKRGWGEYGRKSSLLSTAIRHLVMGAARRALLEAGAGTRQSTREAATMLDEAVLELRTAGYPDYVVRGLLERSRFQRARHEAEDRGRTRDDLNRAAIHVRGGQMALLGIDLELERAACELGFWPEMTRAERSTAGGVIKRGLDTATKGVKVSGYRRRAEMLAELRAQASDRGLEFRSSFKL